MRAKLERLAAFAFAEKKKYEQAVDCDEAAVMNDEEGNHKQLWQMCYWVLDFDKRDFEDVIKADDKVFCPVEKNNIEGAPTENDDTVNGKHICKHKNQ